MGSPPCYGIPLPPPGSPADFSSPCACAGRVAWSISGHDIWNFLCLYTWLAWSIQTLERQRKKTEKCFSILQVLSQPAYQFFYPYCYKQFFSLKSHNHNHHQGLGAMMHYTVRRWKSGLVPSRVSKSIELVGGWNWLKWLGVGGLYNTGCRYWLEESKIYSILFYSNISRDTPFIDHSENL